MGGHLQTAVVKPAKDDVTDILVPSTKSDHHTAEVQKETSQRREDRRQKHIP